MQTIALRVLQDITLLSDQASVGNVQLEHSPIRWSHITVILIKMPGGEPRNLDQLPVLFVRQVHSGT